MQRVMPVQQHEDRLQKVIAIGAAAGDVEEQVELGRSRHVVERAHGLERMRKKRQVRQLGMEQARPAEIRVCRARCAARPAAAGRSEKHTSELPSPCKLVCRLLLEKKKLSVDFTTAPDCLSV